MEKFAYSDDLFIEAEPWKAFNLAVLVVVCVENQSSDLSIVMIRPSWYGKRPLT
jgi:hypothetical protein